MREDPYPARYYGRLVDEPFLPDMAHSLPFDAGISPFQQPLPRIVILLMTLYLACALFLIFAVTSYAAPLGSATISSQLAAPCVEVAEFAAR